MEDLYPDPRWNFVFGQASLHDRVGVFSFARYDPAFFGEPCGNRYQQLLLRRSGRVLAHETARMFSLAHCIYFKCVMNGSNHLHESDSHFVFIPLFHGVSDWQNCSSGVKSNPAGAGALCQDSLIVFAID